MKRTASPLELITPQDGMKTEEPIAGYDPIANDKDSFDIALRMKQGTNSPYGKNAETIDCD